MKTKKVIKQPKTIEQNLMLIGTLIIFGIAILEAFVHKSMLGFSFYALSLVIIAALDRNTKAIMDNNDS